MINALLRTGSDGEPLGFRGVAQVLSYEKTHQTAPGSTRPPETG